MSPIQTTRRLNVRFPRKTSSPTDPVSPRLRAPITRREKAVGNGNALKHGLTSSHVVIERIDGEGARERFAALHKSLRKQFAPDDPIAEFRVQRVAANLWRLDRNDRAEAAMLEEASLHAAQDDLLLRLRLPGILNEDNPGTAVAIEPKSYRLGVLIDRLGQLEEEIRRDGDLSADSVFGTSDPFAIECAMFCLSAKAADPASNGGPGAAPSGAVANLIEQATRLISEKRQQLSKVQQELERLEQQQRAVLATLGIPSPANSERLGALGLRSTKSWSKTWPTSTAGHTEARKPQESLCATTVDEQLPQRFRSRPK